MSGGRNRRAAERRGKVAEAVAALYLTLTGHVILDRRWQSPAGELDLVARRGNRVVFVEVKARRSAKAAAWAISPEGRRRITRAAELWLTRHARHRQCETRFDVITFAGWRLHHLRNAWQAGLS